TSIPRNSDYKFVVKIACILPMNEKDFQRFIAERPALNISALAKELGVNHINLRKIIVGLRQIPKARRGLFYQVAKKYGYTENIEQ
ncbi:MAG TPA: hypothetical protein PKH43_02420, partial [Saprospiraceae bacterium]|nr:hypothetical protein [Saprospiraceae bacterium]